MADRDELVSEMPAQDRYEHATAEDAARSLADRYERRKPTLDALPPRIFPAVSGGSDVPPPPRPPTTGLPDPDYRHGLMVPIEYVMAEGSDIDGRAMVHHVLYRNGHRARAAGLTVVRDAATTDTPWGAPSSVPSEIRGGGEDLVRPASSPAPPERHVTASIAALTDDVFYGLGTLAAVLWLATAALLAVLMLA